MSRATIGVRRLPCGHHAVNPPAELGSFTRKCSTCRTTFWGRVDVSEALSAKCGKSVLRATWEPGIAPAHGLEFDHETNGDRRAASTASGPLEPVKEARNGRR